MSKVRVYELAKDLGIDPTVVERRCRDLGIEVEQHHLAQLTAEEAARVKKALHDEPAGDVSERQVNETVRRRRRRPEERASTLRKAAAAAALAAEEEAEAAEGAAAEALPETPAPVAAGAEIEKAPAPEPSRADEAPAPAAEAEARAEDAPVPATGAEARGEAMAAEAGEAAPGEGVTRRYEGSTAVNVGRADAGEGNRSLVQVVRRIDPAQLQRSLQRRPAAERPPIRRPAGPGGPAPGQTLNIPLPDRSGKTGARGDARKRKKSGRVAFDRDKDQAFSEQSRPRVRRGAKKRKTGGATEITIPKASKRVVKMDETITVAELASQLSVKSSEIIKYLMQMGELVTVNHVLDHDTVTLIAQEYDFTVESVAFVVDDYLPQVDEETADWVVRDPVVTVMGHVDHGKTSLLDYIRKTRVAAGEAGGITQHIGAYKVPVKVGGEKRNLVFLDTPGHAAFSQMRARGAQVTDVVILVVAADDGVMPQTIEAINHAKAAEVPIVVAVNKCDKEDANPERVRQMLTEHGLVAEEWGGETQMVNVSAKTGDGVAELLESVYVQAEVLDLQAVSDTEAQGVVIEAELSRGRGPVATVLVQQGTLHRGDIVVAGTAMGRVRALLDDQGRQVEAAGPSTPVEVVGLDQVPPPSEKFSVVKDEKTARQIVTFLEDKDRKARMLGERKRMSLEDLTRMAETGDVKSLSLIIKSDVQGSLEALRTAIGKLEHPELQVQILHGAVGPISESDVRLATASNAIILGFNVRPEKPAKAAAEQEGVEIRLYSVIYDAIDDVKKAMEGLLSPIVEERALGKAEVRDTFALKGAGTIAGCAVLQGKLVRNGLARLVRDGRVLYTGTIESLRRFKENVSEVDRGKECGVRLHNFPDVKVGDEIECYEEVQVAQTLGI